MHVAFLSLILIYTAFFICVVFRRVTKIMDIPATEKIKCGTYYHLICGLWGGAFAVLIMCLSAGVSLEDIGFRQMKFNYGTGFTAVNLSLCGLLFIYGLYQLISSLASAKYKEAAEKQMESNVVLSGILPRSRKEKRLFSFLSLSAGVCEEIIFRGFMLYLLQAIYPEIPLFLVILIPSVLFGISHFYQRMQGIIMSAVLGAIFMCLFLVTNNLVLAIFLHFFHDFSATFLLSEKNEAEG